MEGVRNCTVRWNTISGNLKDGVLEGDQLHPSRDNVLAGNFIGTDVGGYYAVPNGANGVELAGICGNNRIGTADFYGAYMEYNRNVISGNKLDGACIASKLLPGNLGGNLVSGNYVGLNATGDALVGNGRHGIGIWNSPANEIGGAKPLLGNVISANALNGVLVTGAGSTNNRIEGNGIGTDQGGTQAMDNDGTGIRLTVGAAGTIIGGAPPLHGNVVSGNAMHGITSPALSQKPSSGTTPSGRAPAPDAGQRRLRDLHRRLQQQPDRPGRRPWTPFAATARTGC